MILYWCIWIFICINSISLNTRTKLRKISFFIFMVFISLFIGLRYQVGGDWENYLQMYEYIKYVNFSEIVYVSDFGYALLNYLSQYIGIEDTILVNAICGGMIGLFLYLSFKKLGQYWIMLLIYYPYHILSVSLGYTRQAVALSIVVYSSIFLMERKLLRYVFFIIFACLFHKTAIVFLLLLPIIFFKKKYWLYFYQVISLIFILIILYLSFLSEKNIYLNSSYGINSDGVFMRLSMHIIPIFLYIKFYKKFFLLGRNVISILNYFILLIVLCFLLAVPFSTLSDRFNLYLIFFDLFVVATLYSSLKESPYTRKMIVIALVLYNTAFIFVWLNYSKWAARAWIPYSNYIVNYLLQDVF